MGICLAEKKLTVLSPADVNARILTAVSIILLAIVYLSHLGYMPLDIESDEARRALVSGEMMLSGDYLTPTINGEYYLNKPPLYNDIIAGYFKLFGNYSMFAFRLQVIVAVFITGILIYHFTKKYTNKTIALFSAIAYITNGRLLIYESLYGMIDTTFALVIYANFMLIFYFGQQKKYTQLFIFSYLLTAVAFLLKGLPAIMFQGITLVSYFTMQKNWRELFSAQHFLGIAIFLLLPACYYCVYFTCNDVSVLELFKTLYAESEKRTFLEYDVQSTLLHVITFPAEIIYHFLPWTIFLFALFQKGLLQKIKENPFIQYITVIFLANIPVYAFSVDVYPKYLFMFVPLLYTVGFYFYFNHPKKLNKKIIDNILVVTCIIICAGCLVLLFTNLTDHVEFGYNKMLLLFAGFALCSYMMIKNKYRLHFFVLAIIFVRAGFNWFVVEQRGDRFFQANNTAQKIATITAGKQLYIMNGANSGNFDGMSFEIETLRNEILRKNDGTATNAYYIVDEDQLSSKKYSVDLSFENLPYHNKLFLVH